MNAYRLKPMNFPWPPFLYGTAILVAFAIHRVAGLPTPHVNATIGWCVGILLIAASGWLYIWAIATRTKIRMPRRAAKHLVTHGPYRYSRNPISLSYTLLTMGIGLLTSNAWFFVMATLAAIVTTMIVIRREEMHLLARFGVEFEHYCKRTRRWI